MILTFPQGFKERTAKFIGENATFVAEELVVGLPERLKPYTYHVILRWSDSYSTRSLDKTIEGLKREEFDLHIKWYDNGIPSGTDTLWSYYERVPNPPIQPVIATRSSPRETLENASDRKIIRSVKPITDHLSTLSSRDSDLGFEVYVYSLIPCQRVLAKETIKRASLQGIITEDELMIESLILTADVNRIVVEGVISEIRDLNDLKSRMELYKFGKGNVSMRGWLDFRVRRILMPSETTRIRVITQASEDSLMYKPEASNMRRVITLNRREYVT